MASKRGRGRPARQAGTAAQRRVPSARDSVPHAGSRWKLRAGALLLVLAGCWAYWTSLPGVLALDDVRAIARNETIRKLWPPSVPLSPPPASTVSGRPIANLSFAINYALAPFDARDTFEAPPDDPAARRRLLRNLRGYHLVNLLIHLAASLTLFGVVRRTLGSPVLGARLAAAAFPLALAVALIWVVHPLTTASVTYVVQRVEALASVFYLLTLYCAIRSRAGRGRRAWAAGAVVSCFLGVATKEIVFTAPLMVAAWLWLFEPAFSRRDWRLPAALASSWVVLAALVANEHRTPSLEIGLAASWRYLVTQAEVLTHYLRLAVVPSPLVFFYTWEMHGSIAAVWPQAAFMAGFVLLTAAGLAGRRPTSFAGTWFFLILAPTSSVLPIVTEVAAEHRMYLPLAAPVALLVVGCYALGARLLEGARFGDGRSRRCFGAALGLAATAAVVAALGVATRERNRDYWSEQHLWADTVSKQPGNSRARLAYGTVLAAAGRLVEAEAQFREAVRLAPSDAIAHVRLGSMLAARGEIAAAIEHMERGLALNPDDADAHRGLGQAYALQGNERRARDHFERAVNLTKDSYVMLRLAAILAESQDPTLRDTSKAIQLAEQVVASTSRRDPLALSVLAAAQAAAGRFGDAAGTAAEALPLARARGNDSLVSELERRLVAYGAMAGSD